MMSVNNIIENNTFSIFIIFDNNNHPLAVDFTTIATWAKVFKCKKEEVLEIEIAAFKLIGYRIIEINFSGVDRLLDSEAKEENDIL